jgi:AcrR family transcriptional regulator
MLRAMTKLPLALTKASVEGERISAETYAQERRRETLTSVTKVFAKRGYRGATIDHLVAGAKISMGGFYKFFGGKEDCFVQAYDQVVEEARDRLRDTHSGDESWAAGVSAGLRSLLEVAAADPLAARLVLLEAQSGGPVAVRRYNETLTEVAKALRVGRSAAPATPELPESFEDATVSGVAWLMQNRLSRGEEIDVDELHPHLAKTLLEPYLGRAAFEQLLRDGH